MSQSTSLTPEEVISPPIQTSPITVHVSNEGPLKADHDNSYNTVSTEIAHDDEAKNPDDHNDSQPASGQVSPARSPSAEIDTSASALSVQACSNSSPEAKKSADMFLEENDDGDGRPHSETIVELATPIMKEETEGKLQEQEVPVHVVSVDAKQEHLRGADAMSPPSDKSEQAKVDDAKDVAGGLIQEAKQTNLLLTQILEQLKRQEAKTTEQMNNLAKQLTKLSLTGNFNQTPARENFSQLSNMQNMHVYNMTVEDFREKCTYVLYPKVNPCDDSKKDINLPALEFDKSDGDYSGFAGTELERYKTDPTDTLPPLPPYTQSGFGESACSMKEAFPSRVPQVTRQALGLEDANSAQAEKSNASETVVDSVAAKPARETTSVDPSNPQAMTRHIWDTRYPASSETQNDNTPNRASSAESRRQSGQNKAQYTAGESNLPRKSQNTEMKKKPDGNPQHAAQAATSPKKKDPGHEKEASSFCTPKGSSNAPDGKSQQSYPAPRDVRPKTSATGQPSNSKDAQGSRNADRVAPPPPPPSEGKRFSAMGISIESGSETESSRLHAALERALAPETDPAPKAKSFDTVLCLDISSSMWEGSAFEEMIECANEFLDGIEDIVTESGVEENIALVTFGGHADIKQHLTNDFSRIRDKIEQVEVGGKSPFFEAMIVCLAAFQGKGGTVSVSGEYDVAPRIIFITDGHITECSDDPYGPDRCIDPTNTRARFSRFMMDVDPQTEKGLPHPIVFVPVGSRADRNFLDAMATLNRSSLVEPQNIRSLCPYFRIQETIGKVIVTMLNKQDGGSPEQICAVVQALVPELEQNELNQVVKTVQDELNHPARRKERKRKPTDFDDVFEDKDGVMQGARLPLGTRVVRGPDWHWGNQDSHGPGTVIQHDDKKHPSTWVMWDSGDWNRYAYGPEIGYHIWKTDEMPRLRMGNGDLQIGMTVKKGPNWDCDDPKYGKGTGVIIRKSKDGEQFKVRWENGEIQACSKNAVIYCDPFEQEDEVREQTLAEELFGHRLDPDNENCKMDRGEEQKIPDGVLIWRWQDDWGHWHLYPPAELNKLEKDYCRKKNGTCVIQRDGGNYRVFFRRMAEKDQVTGVERNVQRCWVTADEYASLQKAEEIMLK